MIDSKLIDSSVWIEFIINGNYTEIINKEEIFILSTLSLFEIKKKLMKLNYETIDITKGLDFIKQKSNLIEPDEKIVESAVELSIKYNLGTVDAILYSTANIHNAELVSLDNDFRNLPNAQVLK